MSVFFTEKTSIKWLDVPIQKFNTVVPHFIEVLRTQIHNILKFKRLNQTEEAAREYAHATKTVNQLTSLLTDIDNLRNQVNEEDIQKYDKLIYSSKRDALTAIKLYQDLTFLSSSTLDKEESTLTEIILEDKANKELQSLAVLSEEINRQEHTAASLDRLHEDIQNVNELYQELSKLVQDQSEHVEKIENHTETTHHNVVAGESMLRQAAKYKNGMYPIFGALIGSVLGGPVGLLAGFKLGGLTAVGCGVLGFTGGKMLKNQNDVTIMEAECYGESINN